MWNKNQLMDMLSEYVFPRESQVCINQERCSNLTCNKSCFNIATLSLNKETMQLMLKDNKSGK